MQLNKVLKNLLLALPVIIIAACSSQKNNDNDQSGMGNNLNDGYNSSHLSAEEQTRLQMQQLQKENIVYFGLDKYEIRPDFVAMLDPHAEFLRNNSSYTVTIEGHADERGTPEYNISLGERRSNAVKMYLQGRGVAAEQIDIVSYGKEKPAVLGHDEAAYAQNRRAVLVY